MMSGRIRRICAVVLLSVAVAAGVAVPAGAAPPLSLYGNLPRFERAAISASGDRIAIVGVFGSSRRLSIFDKDQKLLLTLPLGDQKVRSVNWGGEDNVLVRISKTVSLDMEFTSEKAELSAMVVVPLDGRQAWVVFDKKRGITGGTRGYYGAIERDGKWFGHFGGITLQRSLVAEDYLESTSPDLYEVDLHSGNARKIASRTDAQFGYRTWELDQSGEIAATFDFDSKNGDWRIRDGASRIVASGRAPQGGVGLLGVGRSPGTILYKDEDDETGNDRWIEVAAGKSEELFADKSVIAVYSDPRTRLLIGYLESADHPEPKFFDVRRNKVMAGIRRAFPGMTVHLVDWNATFDRLIVTTEGPGDSGSWWLIDVKTGSATQLGASYPMAAEDVGPVRMLSYTAGDGLALAGVLTLPPGREPKDLPVVMLPHGGPSSRDYPEFDWWAQALASRGYAVFQPNFRGSTGYGAAFQRASRGEWGRKMQTDISDGLTELVKQGIVDPRRACIMGASYGGYAALAGVTLQQGLYRCAVSVAGIGDVAEMMQSDLYESGNDPGLRRALRDELGSGRDLKQVSPAEFAARADAPILLIHGKNDTVVRYEQSTDMAAALRRAGKPVEMVTLAQEDHWLSTGATRLAMLEAAVKFIEKHNPPGGDPPPGK